MPRLHSAVRGALVLLLSAVLAATGASAAAAAGAASSASASTGTGTLSLSLASPVGAPTVVTFTGPATFAHSTETGGATRKSFKAPAGTYSVRTPDVVVKGLTYRASTAQRSVAVKRGRTTSVTVTYLPAPMGTDLHITSLSGTSVALAWSAPPASVRGRTALSYVVRRSAVDAPPLTRPTQGSAVPVKGTTSTDSGLSAGARYRYSLFTQSQYGWNGPVELEVGTTAPAGSTDAAYALAPNTELLAAPEIASAVPTGDGVDLRVSDPREIPAVGSAVVLPISTALEGGFLGVVDAVRSDGSVHLVPGGIPDAFDFYELPPTAFSSGPAPGAARALAPQASAGLRAAARSGPFDCEGSLPKSATLDFDPSVRGSGTFEARWDKTLGVTRGAHVGMAFEVVARGAATVSAETSFECSLPLPDLDAQITVFPVPIALKLGPVASMKVAGGIEVSNIGVEARAATRASADFTLPNQARVSGDVDLSVTALKPVVTSTATLTTEIGGELLIGPGAGTEAAGVILGISGSLTALKSEFKAAFEASDPRAQVCYSVKHQYGASVAVTARAWAPLVDVSKTLEIPGLSSTKDYPAPPSVPEGCDGLPAPLRITTGTIGEPAVASPYRFVLASSADDPATWSTPSGGLPPGLALSPAGVISGTPSAAGDFSVTFKVVAAGEEAFKAFTIRVNPPLPPPVAVDPDDIADLAGFVKTYFVCGGSCSGSWGDPHLTTVDGVHYDYQGAGEFVAARSGSGAAEVQVRQQPWGSSRLVSVNTAVAVRVGEHRLAVYRTGDGVDVRLDGRPAQLTQQARSLGTAGQVVLDAAGRVLVTWADGSALAVGAGVPQALDLQFSPGAAMVEGMTGLLAAGAEEAAPVRVSATTSLFDYAAGESTATFTDTAFPYGTVSVDSLPAAQKQAATALCSGVGVDEKAQLDACVLDVAVTGEPRFAVSAAESQAATSSSVVASSAVGDPWRDAAGRTGTAVLTYDHVGCTAVDAASRCTDGVWGDPVPGVPFTWSNRGTTEGQGDVTFTKTFSVTESAAGRPATMTLWADQEATATVNGKAVPRAVYPAKVSAPVTLRAGENTVTVVVSNAEGFNPRYNPAGLAWKIAFDDDSAGGTATSFDIRDFSSADAVRLTGSAQVVDRKLRLTDSYSQKGYAWHRTAMSTTRSFSTTFDVTLASDGWLGDGMALVFQTDPRGVEATGGGGGGLGYDGIRPLVGVELDTVYSGGADPDDNHVAIAVDGVPGATGAHLEPLPRLAARTSDCRGPHRTGGLRALHRSRLQHGHDGVMPQEPTVDLSGMGAEGRVGFTASTGAAYVVADVSRWSFGAKAR